MSIPNLIEVQKNSYDEFLISKSKNYKKKLKGKTTDEAKTDVEFSVYDHLSELEIPLNGITRIETDKNIRKIFGTIDDFLTTSMASQLDSLSYLNEGSTRRKEILAKFLDLEIFDQKFKLVKEDSSDMKGALKKLSDRDYDSEIKESNSELALADTELMHKQRKQEEMNNESQELQLQLIDLEKQFSSIPEDVIDIGQVAKKLKKLKQEVSITEVNIKKKQEVLNSEEAFLQKIQNFINGFNIEDINNQKQTADEYRQRIDKIEAEINTYEQQKEVIDHKIDLLRIVPCTHKLQEKCHFVSDARRAIDDVNRVKIGMNQLTLNKKTITRKLEELNPAKLNEYSEKYYMIQEKKVAKGAQVSDLKLQIERDKISLMQMRGVLEGLKEKEQLYEQN